jgi:hypothetical protein
VNDIFCGQQNRKLSSRYWYKLGMLLGLPIWHSNDLHTPVSSGNKCLPSVDSGRCRSCTAAGVAAACAAMDDATAWAIDEASRGCALATRRTFDPSG